MNQLVPISSATLPALIAAAGECASMRFLEFFAANIRIPHTRRAYARAADEFLAWCAGGGVSSIAVVQPAHVATWIEAGTRELAAPSAKQRLAAIRHLFGGRALSEARRHAVVNRANLSGDSISVNHRAIIFGPYNADPADGGDWYRRRQMGWRSIRAIGNAAAQKAAMTQNPCAPK
jgi:hypothetical protein